MFCVYSFVLGTVFDIDMCVFASYENLAEEERAGCFIFPAFSKKKRRHSIQYSNPSFHPSVSLN